MPLLPLFILLSFLCGCARPSPAPQVPPAPQISTGITGKVLDARNHPLADTWVYVYRNRHSGLRGPADFAARSDRKGNYLLDLSQGRYYLVARWRKSGADAGPPQPGDAWALAQGNPVEVKDGELRRVDFRLQVINSARPNLRQENLPGKTTIRGRLLDAKGRPLAGAFALAYSSVDFRRKPDFTSAVVGRDGRFVLHLPGGGRYCLAARTRTRGQPQRGEPYGRLGEGEKACIVIQKDRIITVPDLILRPFGN